MFTRLNKEMFCSDQSKAPVGAGIQQLTRVKRGSCDKVQFVMMAVSCLPRFIFS